MKAVGWLIFMFFTQLMISILAVYYLPTSWNNPYVNQNELYNIENDTAAITGDNQFAILNFQAWNRFSKLRKIFADAVKPTGTFFDSLFPNVLPSAFVTGLDILWAIILVASGIEFMRGYRLK